VLAASHKITEARAVVTIAAPYDPGHVTGLFQGARRDTRAGRGRGGTGRAAVPHQARIPRRRGRAETRRLSRRLAQGAAVFIRRPTHGRIYNASHIFGAAKHPKSFVSLPAADHLLKQQERRGLLWPT